MQNVIDFCIIYRINNNPTIVKTTPAPAMANVTSVVPDLGNWVTIGGGGLVTTGLGVLVGFWVGVAEGTLVGWAFKVGEGVLVGPTLPMFRVRGVRPLQLIISVASLEELILESAPVPGVHSNDKLVVPAALAFKFKVAHWVSLVAVLPV